MSSGVARARLAYIAEAAIGELLPGLPPRAASRSDDRLERLGALYGEFATTKIAYADEPIAWPVPGGCVTWPASSPPVRTC